MVVSWNEKTVVTHDSKNDLPLNLICFNLLNFSSLFVLISFGPLTPLGPHSTRAPHGYGIACGPSHFSNDGKSLTQTTGEKWQGKLLFPLSSTTTELSEPDLLTLF